MLCYVTELRGNDMGIRMEYTVEKLPDSYVTTKTVYSYEPDPDWTPPLGVANPRPGKIRKETVVEERGGWLYTFMRGHQIRVTTEEQMKLLGLTAEPRLIDDSTGLQVNAQGIPLDIAEHVKMGPLADGGTRDTVASLTKRGSGDPIEDAINDTE